MPAKRKPKTASVADFLAAPENVLKDQAERRKLAERKAREQARQQRILAGKRKKPPSTEDLLADIIRVAEDPDTNPLGAKTRSISRQRYELYGHFPVAFVDREFGQWNHALEAAGLRDKQGTRMWRANRSAELAEWDPDVLAGGASGHRLVQAPKDAAMGSHRVRYTRTWVRRSPALLMQPRLHDGRPVQQRSRDGRRQRLPASGRLRGVPHMPSHAASVTERKGCGNALWRDLRHLPAVWPLQVGGPPLAVLRLLDCAASETADARRSDPARGRAAVGA